jgi:hypothetical protein
MRAGHSARSAAGIATSHSPQPSTRCCCLAIRHGGRQLAAAEAEQLGQDDACIQIHISPSQAQRFILADATDTATDLGGGE